MNRKLEQLIESEYDLITSLLLEKKHNERLIGKWQQNVKEYNSRYFAGLKEGYIEANKALKTNIRIWGISLIRKKRRINSC